MPWLQQFNTSVVCRCNWLLGRFVVTRVFSLTIVVVEQWIQTGFRPLTNFSSKVSPEVGESVLWRGVCKGRQGGPSTKVEHFHGKVRHVAVDERHELFLYVDCEAVKEVRKIHTSYVEVLARRWLCASGGRCHREAEVRSNFIEVVRCPECTLTDRWFNSEDSYRQHFRVCHRGSA